MFHVLLIFVVSIREKEIQQNFHGFKTWLKYTFCCYLKQFCRNSVELSAHLLLLCKNKSIIWNVSAIYFLFKMFILVKLYSTCSTSVLNFVDHIGFAQNSCFIDFRFLFLFIVSMEKSIALRTTLYQTSVHFQLLV